MDKRWIIKRGLKWAAEYGSLISGHSWLYNRNPRGFRILNYHRVEDEPSNSHSIKTTHFNLHMKYLSDHYYVISLNEIMVRLLNGDDEPDGVKIAITFDDGYSEYLDLLNLLIDLRIPATFFITTGVLDRPVVDPANLTWDGVKTIAEMRFDIGSHTVNHKSLASISPGESYYELSHSKLRLEQETGLEIKGVAYPYGTIRDFSGQVSSQAQRLGYTYGLTAIHGLTPWRGDRFAIGRTTITAGDGLRTFKLLLKGCIDPWRLVDLYGYKYQRTNYQ